MGKGLKIAAGVVAVVIAIALVAPIFVPLNSYKPLIAEKVKIATGRDLKIDGDISLSLLPIPSVSVGGVKFGNAPGGSVPDMVSLEKARVKIALLPLLGGNIEVSEIVLEKPIIVLEKFKDGTVNWQITPAGGQAAASATTNQATTQPGTKSTPSSLNVVIAGASIEDGTIIYRDAATGSERRVENVNVDLAMDSLQGPFSASGGATALGVPIGFNVKLGRMDQTAPVPVDASLSVSEVNASIGFNGTVDMAAANAPGKPIVVGKLSGKGDSLAKLLAVLPGADKSVPQPPLLDQPFGIDGSVSADKTSATVKDLSLQLDDLNAKAAIAATYAKDVAVQANVAVGRVDLDKLLPAGGRQNTETTAAPASTANTKTAATFNLLGGITVGADIAIQQIVFRGQPIDGTKLSLQLANSQLTIKSLTAQLPGATGLGASGVLYADQGQPAFTGGINISAGNLRGLIDAFAKGAVDGVPGDRLRKFTLASKINYKNNQVDFSQINSQLDQSSIQGGVSVVLPNGKQRQQMGFGANLSIDKVNADGYLPKASAKPPATADGSTAKKLGDNPLKSLAPLGDLNTDIEMKIGSLTLNQQQINGLHLAFSSGGGSIDVKDLSVADFIGGKGAMIGKISDLRGNPRFDTDFNVTANEAGSVMQMAGAGNAMAGKLGALTLGGKVSGTLDEVNYDASVGLASIGANMAGKIAGISGGNPQVDTTLDLSVQKLGPILRMAGLAGPKADSAGALTVAGTLKGGADKMLLDLKLQGLGGTAALAGTVAAKTKPVAFDISLNVNHPQFSDLLRIADLPNSGVQAGPLKLTMKAAGTTQKANIGQLDASWGDSSITGTAAYDATAATPLMTATLSGGTVNLIPFTGGSTTSTSKTGTDNSTGGTWSAQPLNLSALKSQDANIDFKAGSLIIPSERIDNLIAKITIKGGVMTTQTLSGKVYGGGFDLSGTTVDGNGKPKIDAKILIDKIQLGQVMSGGIAGSQVKGPLSLNMNVTGSGDSQAELVRSLTGKGSIDGTIMIIGKIEQQLGSVLLGVLGQKVKAIQGISDTINGVLGNFTGVDNILKGTFDVANGILNTQDFSFTNPRAHGTAKGQIDLSSLTFAPMRVDLFSGNADRAFMSINLEGPVGNPHPSFATNGSAGSSGILGINPSGQVQPDLIQQIPGGSKLLQKLGIQPNPSGAGTTTPSGGAGSTPSNIQTTPPATQSAPTINVPGLGDIQLPFGKKKKNSDTTQQPTQQPGQQPTQQPTQPPAQ